ncbi:MAG: polyphosphate polymerase domain-containing protein, partial [Bacteroidales bacterium]|nr:polyphosphate polymerase domain-containing protein [Bacteroidales bacterium]
HIQDSVLKILAEFDSVCLGDLPVDSQMSRFDKKYIFPGFLIPEIVRKATGTYKVLEIANKRLLEYRTQYFDTPQYNMYHDHHNGKGERYKIRLREYVDSKDTFLEIKHKTNKGLTIKQRIVVPEVSIYGENARYLIRTTTPYSTDDLMPSLSTEFKRFTLLNNKSWERITLDLCLDVWQNGEKHTLPWLGIAEVKKSNPHVKVMFKDILSDSNIHPRNFSKYCTGLAYLNRNIKINNFKANLLILKNFENEHYNHIEHLAGN